MSIVTVCVSAGVNRWILRNQGQQFYLFEPLLYFEGDRNFGLPLPGRPRLGRAQDVGPLPRKERYSLIQGSLFWTLVLASFPVKKLQFQSDPGAILYGSVATRRPSV